MLAENDNNYERADLDFAPPLRSICRGRVGRVVLLDPAGQDGITQSTDSCPLERQARYGCQSGRLARRASANLVLDGDPTAVSLAAAGRSPGHRLRMGRDLAGRINPRQAPDRRGHLDAQCAGSLGLDDRWLLPLLLVVILLGWQVVSYRDWRFSPGILAGMAVESLVWAVMLVGISRLIDAGFSYLEQRETAVLAIEPVKGSPIRCLFDRLRRCRHL